MRDNLRLIIKLLKNTGLSTWDYTTLNLCYPQTCLKIKSLFSELGINFNKHNILHLSTVQSYLKETN